MSAAAPLLDVREIHTAYGLSRVLFGVSLQIGAGECVCLLGRNGVGKSTTMRSIIGLTPPQAGRVLWKGADITGWEPYRVARAGIGFVPEDRRIFADLTVWENLDVASRRSREPSREPGGERCRGISAPPTPNPTTPHPPPQNGGGACGTPHTPAASRGCGRPPAPLPACSR